MLLILFAVAVWAGIQNALAGGGSFVTLPALILSGLDARAANIASTIALFPGQVTTGWVGRKSVSGAGDQPCTRISTRLSTSLPVKPCPPPSMMPESRISELIEGADITTLSSRMAS